MEAQPYVDIYVLEASLRYALCLLVFRVVHRNVFRDSSLGVRGGFFKITRMAWFWILSILLDKTVPHDPHTTLQ